MSKALPDIDFRHLSEIHSERPEFVTLYLNTPDRQFERTFIENRQTEIQAALGPYPGLRKALDREVERIVGEIETRGVRGEALAVFSCAARTKIRSLAPAPRAAIDPAASMYCVAWMSYP